MAQEKASGEAAALPLYKGKPLVRSGNTLYYGDPSDKYIAMLQIISNKTVADMELADKVSVQILLTDENVHTSKRIVKKTEKNGLYTALNIASIWLERALAERN
jgi:hypothetical protein